MSIVIVSAIKNEASPTLELFEKRGCPFTYCSIGVGPLQAAKASSELAETCRGKRVIYIGSAGSYEPFTSPYLVTVDRVVWSPTGERFGLAECPNWLYPPVEVHPHPRCDLPRKTVLCSTGITVSDLPPPEGMGSDYIENMELYACINELQQAALELTIILGITNHIGPQGRQQWLKNYTLVAEMTADYLKNFKS